MGMVGFDELAEADAAELRALVAEHLARTDSPVAARVLERWDALLGQGAFIKVMPHDYKRVLRELAEAQALSDQAADNGALAAPRALDAVGEAGV
jgi:glutamate synthase domain-containing protein 3